MRLNADRVAFRATAGHYLCCGLFVLEAASRLNVLDHGNLAKLREDAAALAPFLSKPLWDAA